MFDVVAQKEINKYDLPAELAEDANEYCNKFIPGKVMQSPITYKELTNWTVLCKIF